MSMRIATTTITDRLLTDLRRGYQAYATTQGQVSSGKQVTRPSDDPLAASEIRTRRSALDGLAHHKEATGAATTWLTAAEGSLSSVTSLLQRARELTVQASNGTLQQSDRDRIAQEIDQLAEAAKDAMGAKVGDAYVFSGTASTTAPYAAGSDAYAGDAGTLVRDVGPGIPLALNAPIRTIGGGSANLTADAVLGSSTAAPADGRVLATLRTLAADLRAGTPAALQAIRSADLQALDANLAVVSDARASVGAVQNRVDAAASRIDDLSQVGATALSDLEDTDLAKALTLLSQQQTAYQAALKSGAAIIQPSLLDFLR